MASNADIANLTLGRLRVGKAITSLDDQTTEARICNRFFTQCRQEVLRAYNWQFAKRIEQLAEVSGQEFPGWGYVYQYPNNCLAIRHVCDEGGIRYARYYWNNMESVQAQQMPWEIALKNDNASKVVLSDVASAWCIYTVDLENAGVFPPDFVSVFSWRLAIEVGGPLQADQSRIDLAEQNYVAWFSQAAANNQNEMRDDPYPDSPSIQARY